MADNFAYTPGTGETGGADDIGGVKYPRVKLIHGADGTNDGDVSTANGLPVQGTVTANLGATDNAVLDQIELNQDSQTTILTTIDGDTGAIKTAIELLDNAVDGNYLNVNANIAGTDMVGGAGAVAAGVQRVTLASDDPAVTDLAALEVLATTIAGDTTSIDGKITACNTGAIAGTVTAELSATDNAVLDTIDSVLDTINAKLVTGTVIGDVNLGATDNAVLDDIATKLGTIDEDTNAIKTAVEVIDNAISGTEMQVDVVAALPAGTNNIGDVDVASIANGSLNGPGSPTIDSYTHAAFNLAAGANQVLVSSAASKQIWVYGIGFTTNVAGTVSFQDEDDTAITGIMNIDAKGGMVVSPSGNFAMPIWKLGTDKDLEVDVVTAELDGWVDYAIVSV